MDITEIIGVTFALICVWLTVRQNIWCWPTGILNNIFFITLFAKDRLYADLFLQVIYIALGFYGWWMWLYGSGNKTGVTVSRTNERAWLRLAAIFVFGVLLLAFGLKEFARWMGFPPASFLYWDSATTVACLIAQWMLTKKLLENWIIWIATNLSYIGLYAIKERPLLCLLQVVFIALSALGFIEWLKTYREKQMLGERSVI